MGNLIWVSFVLPKIRAFTTPIIMLFVIANNSPLKKVVRSQHSVLSMAANDALNMILILLALDPKCGVFVYLGMLKTRKLIPFTDASG